MYLVLMRSGLINWIKRLLRVYLNYDGLTMSMPASNILTLMLDVRPIASLLRNI